MLQVGTATKDMKRATDRWAEILGATPPQMPTRESQWIFRGEVSNAKLKAAFVPFGDMEVEMVSSETDGSNLFLEFLNQRGNGVQHFAFSVDNMQEAIKHFADFGIPVAMVSATPPDPSRPNNDTHLMDSREKLGVDVELFHRVTCCDRDPLTFNGRLRPMN